MPVPAWRRPGLVALVLAPLVPLAAPAALAAGEADPPPPRPVADFCQNVPAGYAPFTDIADSTFEENIECLAASAITLGGPGELPESQYGPGLSVRRDAMASFVARLIDTANELDSRDRLRELPAYDGAVTPTDVDSSRVHAAAIDRLYEAGIVSGGPGGRPPSEYGPSLEVPRAQMSSFIANALAFLTREPLQTDQDFFTDDEAVPAHEPNINAVAALGIAVGDGADTYEPARTVTRDQMSAYLTRALAALADAGLISPLPFRGEVAGEAAVATVGDSAVTDDGGVTSPEGAALVPNG